VAMPCGFSNMFLKKSPHLPYRGLCAWRSGTKPALP
jgi:hypothetical protein